MLDNNNDLGFSSKKDLPNAIKYEKKQHIFASKNDLGFCSKKDLYNPIKYEKIHIFACYKRWYMYSLKLKAITHDASKWFDPHLKIRYFPSKSAFFVESKIFLKNKEKNQNI